jgi:glucans biosynthesis protein C
MQGTHESPRTARRYELDWLRVLVIGFVFVFHIAQIFVDGHPMEKDRTSETLGIILAETDFLRMPVLFFVAGAGTWFLLRRRGTLEFLRERGIRLGIPLVVLMILIVPVQTWYIERFWHDDQPPFLEFWPQFLVDAFPRVTAQWAHLWFIGYLLIFSVIASPMFAYLRTPGGKALLERCTAYMDRSLGIILLALPLVFLHWALEWQSPFAQGLIKVDDLLYFILFCYGFVLFSSSNFVSGLDRYKQRMLITGFVLLGAWLVIRVALGTAGDAPTSPIYALHALLTTTASWVWMVAIIGYARKFLSVENRFLRYARQASYPFYLIHLPVVMVAGYYVVPLAIHPIVKFLLIGAITLVVSFGVYEYLIRRCTPLRVVFGLKPEQGPDDIPLIRRLEGHLSGSRRPESGTRH